MSTYSEGYSYKLVNGKDDGAYIKIKNEWKFNESNLNNDLKGQAKALLANALKEGGGYLALTFLILTGFIHSTNDMVFWRAGVGAVGIYMLLSVHGEQNIFHPLLILIEGTITFCKLKPTIKSFYVGGIILGGAAIKAGMALLGGLAASEFLVRIYGQKTIELIAEKVLWNSTDNSNNAQLIFYTFPWAFIYAFYYFQLRNRSNAINYIDTGILNGVKKKLLYDEATANLAKSQLPSVLASAYFISVIGMNKIMGDPIQIGVVLSIGFATGNYRGVWQIFLGNFLGMSVAMLMYLFNNWYSKNKEVVSKKVAATAN